MQDLNFVTHIKDTLLRRPTVQGITGLSRSALYAAVNKGTFPTPVKIGKRAIAWRASDVSAWISIQGNSPEGKI